ncbi:hypothetical protein Gotri_023688, partial [Gossypium trilobum]|nr:hypothetical protein [Gossypium trilobum]
MIGRFSGPKVALNCFSPFPILNAPIIFLGKFTKSHKNALKLLNFSKVNLKIRPLNHLVTLTTTSPWYDELLHSLDLSNSISEQVTDNKLKGFLIDDIGIDDCDDIDASDAIDHDLDTELELLTMMNA